MRYVITAILALFIATPAFADTLMCSIANPHSCQEQIEELPGFDNKSNLPALEMTRPVQKVQDHKESQKHASLDQALVLQTPAFD